MLIILPNVVTKIAAVKRSLKHGHMSFGQ